MADRNFLRSTSATAVAHVLVQHNLLARLWVRSGHITFALAELEMEPLLVVPGLVGGSESGSRRDNIDGTMALDKPL